MQGTIPGGTTFILTPPAGPTTFTWTANVGAGTSILFTMFDSRGRNGGTSDVKTVGITNDASCLDNTSPSSTPAPVPSPTPTSSHISATTKSRTPVETSPLPSVSPESGSKTSVAAIAGTVIGALVFLAVAVTLGLFYLRKRKDSNQRRPRTELDPYNAPDTPGNYPYSSGAVAATSASPMALMPGAGYDSNPFLDNPPGHSPHHQTDYAHPPPSPYQPPSHYQAPYQETPQYPQYPSSQSQYSNISHQRSPTSDPDPFNPYSLAHEPPPAIIEPFDLTERSSARDSMSTTQRKAAMAGMSTYTPSRFIIHTDVEDELPPPNQDGFVELPPQYSERRGPLMSAAASSSAANYPPSGS
ncbi:hypothetical protein H0H81_011194 [Sphagnurus paluster]|uniref:Uncharacterized protein n=1 Tax=Sphagnurus paluster TaxID=117069 RepID=A0A9P7FU48_9AGAR|nr:hypothetical protein H0H81_011194 [Sphagnurus paluster]